MPESARGSDYRKVTVIVGEKLPFFLVTVPIYREVKVGVLHKVPMWDFVQVAVMMTRVSCSPKLSIKKWLLVWELVKRLCNSTKRVGVAGAEGGAEGGLPKIAFRREGMTSRVPSEGKV
ncbi:unnamed protein product [Prunus armeniaca]